MDTPPRQRIVPYYWFESEAQDAADFYAALFGTLLKDVGRTAHSRIDSYYPDESLPDFQQGLEGQPLVASAILDGFEIGLLNGHDFSIRPTSAMSLMLDFDPLIFGDKAAAQKHLRSLWQALATDGEVLIGLDAYPFSELYGWVQDRYGISWQLMLANPDGDPRPFVIPNLLFTGDPVQDQAGPAVDAYTELFADVFDGVSAVGARVFSAGAAATAVVGHV